MTPQAAAALTLLVVGCGTSKSGTMAASHVPRPPSDSVDVTLFLIGDAGAPAPGSEPVLVALQAAARRAPHAIVVFLGDNVYPHGLPDSMDRGRHEATRRLDAQLAVMRKSGAHGMFLPGNHDWDRRGTDGWAAIRREARHVEAQPGVPAKFLPNGGCPGPVVVDVGLSLRLVVLDTQWWLHRRAPPVTGASACPAASEAAVLDSLRAALRGAGARRIVVAGHHPLESGGHHGGHFSWTDHVFPLRDLESWLWIPLPLVGSAYPLARELGISNQDVAGPAYRHMRKALAAVLAESAPLVYAAGHDHNLQVLAGGNARYLLVSGAGIYGHQSYVTREDSSRFAASAAGYMRLDLLSDLRVRLAVDTVSRWGRAAEAFSMWLR